MESKETILRELCVLNYELALAIFSWKHKDAQKLRYRRMVLKAKITMENHNVSISEKRRLGGKLDRVLKQMEKARKSGDTQALVAAKKKFRDVQDEIKQVYGE